ncbi:hypothetical protein [Ponticaulis koreensis]|uniref:hypothetical protein n=1 Tax=Ponticaulis koreensis TaxID=1123045 RepID=UPI0012DC64FA|nr:hypothetical protein [Ponticaulis koreensis]
MDCIYGGLRVELVQIAISKCGFEVSWMKMYIMTSALLLLAACASQSGTDPVRPFTNADPLGVVVYEVSEEMRTQRIGLSIGRLDGNSLDVVMLPGRRNGRDPFGNFSYAEGAMSYFWPRYNIAYVDPGTYAVETIHHQSIWHLCLAEQTVKFEVRPGEVTFLGQLISTNAVQEISERAREEGSEVLRGQAPRVYFQGDFTPVSFALPDDASRARLQTYMYQNYRLSDASVVGATYETTSFAADGGWLGSGFRQRCAE